MYNSNTNNRGRYDNSRRGSSYENDYSNRNQNQNNYSDSGRRDNDRFEDDRYHNSNYGRREEDNYGPFSNVYSNENESSRKDFDTRYNDKSNYYYGNGPVNDRSDEARGMSFGDLFNGRKRNQSDTDYYYNSGHRSEDNRDRYDNDRDYDRNRNYNSSYSNDDRNERSSYRNNDDRNFFERAGDRIKDTWNDWRDTTNNRDNRNDYLHHENRYGANDRDRDKSYNGYSTDYNKRRRTEGYNY